MCFDFLIHECKPNKCIPFSLFCNHSVTQSKQKQSTNNFFVVLTTVQNIRKLYIFSMTSRVFWFYTYSYSVNETCTKRWFLCCFSDSVCHWTDIHKYNLNWRNAKPFNGLNFAFCTFWLFLPWSFLPLPTMLLIVYSIKEAFSLCKIDSILREVISMNKYIVLLHYFSNNLHI